MATATATTASTAQPLPRAKPRDWSSLFGYVLIAPPVLTLFPLFVPGVILAFALIRFLGTHGMLDRLLQSVGFNGFVTPYLQPQGIVIALIWEHIPFTVLVLTAGFGPVGDAVLESARDVRAH